MHKENKFYLGRIVKKHGFNGDLVIKLETDHPELFTNLESILILKGGNMIPFLVLKSSLSNEQYLKVSLQNVDCEEDSTFLMKSEIYIENSEVPVSEGDDYFDHEILGHKVIDVNMGEIGKLASFNRNSSQTLLEIENGDNIFFIPEVPEFVLSIDNENKIIKVEIPKELISLSEEKNS
ncbi:MAG: 16S rRNA processing protein RimM [Flavobacteriaceae bacterium]|nr:16S rRNA processing protein RimM [Flavobacteriaceae bacterium]